MLIGVQFGWGTIIVGIRIGDSCDQHVLTLMGSIFLKYEDVYMYLLNCKHR